MNDEQQMPKKASPARFDSVSNQFSTIGGKTSGSQDTKKSESREVKKSKFQDTQRSKEEKKQQTVYLTKDMQKWLRVRAPLEERDISDIVMQALEEYKAKVEEV